MASSEFMCNYKEPIFWLFSWGTKENGALGYSVRGDATIIKMHKHKLLCFAADMEMLPINCSFHSASLGRTKDNQTLCSAVNFKPPKTTANLKPIKLWRVRVAAHCENKY